MSRSKKMLLLLTLVAVSGVLLCLPFLWHRTADAPKPDPPDWSPDPALLSELKTEFRFDDYHTRFLADYWGTSGQSQRSPKETHRFHYTIKLPDGARFTPHGSGRLFPNIDEYSFDLTNWDGIRGQHFGENDSTNIGALHFYVYIKVASPEDRQGKPFERSWDELKKQPQVARNCPGLEHGDVDEGRVNSATFFRARLTSHNNQRGYAYVSYDGEEVVHIVFMVVNTGDSEAVLKHAEAVVLTWQRGVRD